MVQALVEFRRTGGFARIRRQTTIVSFNVCRNICCGDVRGDVLDPIVTIDFVERVIRSMVIVEVIRSVLRHSEYGHAGEHQKADLECQLVSSAKDKENMLHRLQQGHHVLRKIIATRT
jgi:hypothetical protein